MAGAEASAALAGAAEVLVVADFAAAVSAAEPVEVQVCLTEEQVAPREDLEVGSVGAELGRVNFPVVVLAEVVCKAREDLVVACNEVERVLADWGLPNLAAAEWVATASAQVVAAQELAALATEVLVLRDSVVTGFPPRAAANSTTSLGYRPTADCRL